MSKNIKKTPLLAVLTVLLYLTLRIHHTGIIILFSTSEESEVREVK